MNCPRRMRKILQNHGVPILRTDRLIKELWAFDKRRIAVRFAYEWHDDSGNWCRSYGNENWEFADNGLMHQRREMRDERAARHVARDE